MPRATSSTPSRKKDRSFGPLTSAPKEKEILVYDVESKSDRTQKQGFTRPFMVGFLDEQGTYTPFFDIGKCKENEDFRAFSVSENGCIHRFLRHVLYQDEKTHRFNPRFTSDVANIYAHNGGRFDATFLLVWLYNHRSEFDVTVVTVQGRIQQLRVTPKGMEPKDKNSVLFFDSALLLPMKLDKATSLFSLGGETKNTDFDKNTHEDDPSWVDYNRRDCVGLRDAILGFARMLQSEGGELAMTAPSASMKLFRRRFLKKSFSRGKHFPWCDGTCQGCTRGSDCAGECHGCLHEWIRRGYFGGRVEIFSRYAPPPLYYYDLNSSYPASMLERMPVGKPLDVLSHDAFMAQYEERLDKGQVGFVEVTVSIPSTCEIPPLPVLHDGKLKFPTGSFTGVFELQELLTILDPFVGGSIDWVHRAVFFEGKIIFKDFVDTLYRYKNEKPKGDPEKFTDEQARKFALAELAKLMLNSLYGKFAMNSEREEILFLGKGDPWPDNAKPIDGRHETCSVWTKPKYVDPTYVIPQWSARITALSRRRWWERARDVVLAGGKVFYGDTDAILSSIPFPKDVIDDVKLGFWKREHEKKTLSGEFVLPKFYALFDEEDPEKSIFHMKGVQRDFHNFDTFKLMVSGKEWRVVENRTSQPKTVLRNLEKGGPQGIVMLDAVKSLRSKYDKRIVHPDGTTSPLVLLEEG